jgi:hypothetical protein
MDETEVRSLIKVWYRRARSEQPISKFVFLWFCFNAWLVFESGEDRDRRMLDWLKNSEASRLRAPFELASGSEVFRGYLDTLAKMSPIESTGRRKRAVRIESPNDFAGLVEGIYLVRCNLFHGGKRPDDARDQKLVMTCGRILERWIGNLLAGRR